MREFWTIDHSAMNSRCPNCNHRFRYGERKRFLTWHLSRRPSPCPNCRTILAWERKAHLRLWIGLFLLTVFDGILLGASLAPQIGILLGFSSPESVLDPYWHSWTVRVTEIISLVLTVAAFALMLSGFLKYRLIRYNVV